MKFYSEIDLKGSAELIKNDKIRTDRLNCYSGKYQLSRFFTREGGISITSSDGSISMYTDNSWNTLNLQTYGNHGLTSIGYSNSLQYISISTPGNSEFFGFLNVDRRRHSFASNGINSKGIFFGGWDNPAYTNAEHINMLTFANATLFDPAFTGIRRFHTTSSNRTGDRAVTAGGVDAPAKTTLEYMTISTLSNGILFGNLWSLRYDHGSCNNGLLNRMVMLGGYSTAWTWTMQYIDISTIGDSEAFASLSYINGGLRGCSNSERNRALIVGHTINSTYYCTIEFISINHLVNSHLFGELSGWHYSQPAIDNGCGNRAIFPGSALYPGTTYNIIDYCTISHWGNAYKFGYLNYTNSNHHAIGGSNA